MVSERNKQRFRNLLVYGAPLAVIGGVVGFFLRQADYAHYSDAVSQGWGVPAANIWGPAILGGRTGDFDRPGCDDAMAIGSTAPPHGQFGQVSPGCWQLGAQGGGPPPPPPPPPPGCEACHSSADCPACGPGNPNCVCVKGCCSPAGATNLFGL